MKIRRTAENEVQATSENVIPLHGAHAEKTKQDASILKPRPALPTVALTHDLIAERARTIRRERGGDRASIQQTLLRRKAIDPIVRMTRTVESR